MLNLLRADLFRTIRSVSLWIWIGVVVAMLAFVVAMLDWTTSPEFAQLVNSSISEESVAMMPEEERAKTLADAQTAFDEMETLNEKSLTSITATWSNTFFDGGLLGIASICFLVIYLLSDFKHGYVKNLPMDRRGRTRYYLAKLVYIALVQAFFLLVCAGMTTLFFAIAGFTYDTADTAGEIALWLVMAWCSCMTYGFVCMALAWAVRNEAIAAVGAVVIGAGVLGSFLYSLLNYLGGAVPPLAGLAQWLPVTSIMDLRRGGAALLTANPEYALATMPVWGHVLIVSAAFIMVSWLFVLLVCKKRDIR